VCVREEEDKKELLGDQQRLPTPALHCMWDKWSHVMEERWAGDTCI
jgi:hypothetical protein